MPLALHIIKLWVMLSFAQDWRWLLDRDDSPWYASVKMYQKGSDRSWVPVLERITADLLDANFNDRKY